MSNKNTILEVKESNMVFLPNMSNDNKIMDSDFEIDNQNTLIQVNIIIISILSSLFSVLYYE